ncbi:hypothetical protein OB236_13220 [Paenibacillus sp. WQ 127069]|uniref:Uncharacterized protein n=1 Tax=Paenibacillus baimaensis TaxID=2982185 RepID=A0ABT2UEK6_9BACL|nr:hypothetical protein [Paenibacillus sp. WQ 127069]MCU6793080.1 hypothetical protein [Paenibacillus sp. WQ 127069]
MKSTYDIGDFHFECGDVNANTWVGIRVFKYSIEEEFFGFDGKGEAAFRARCYEVHKELTRKR